MPDKKFLQIEPSQPEIFAFADLIASGQAARSALEADSGYIRYVDLVLK